MAKAADWPVDGLTLGWARQRLVDPALLARYESAETAVLVREPFAEPRRAFEAQRVAVEFFHTLAAGPYRIDGCRGWESWANAERADIALSDLRQWRIDWHENRAVDQHGVPWFDLRVVVVVEPAA